MIFALGIFPGLSDSRAAHPRTSRANIFRALLGCLYAASWLCLLPVFTRHNGVLSLVDQHPSPATTGKILSPGKAPVDLEKFDTYVLWLQTSEAVGWLPSRCVSWRSGSHTARFSIMKSGGVSISRWVVQHGPSSTVVTRGCIDWLGVPESNETVGRTCSKTCRRPSLLL